MATTSITISVMTGWNGQQWWRWATLAQNSETSTTNSELVIFVYLKRRGELRDWLCYSWICCNWRCWRCRRKDFEVLWALLLLLLNSGKEQAAFVVLQQSLALQDKNRGSKQTLFQDLKIKLLAQAAFRNNAGLGGDWRGFFLDYFVARKSVRGFA